MAIRYYLRDHPRSLYRLETPAGRIELWSVDEWLPTILSVTQLGEAGGEEYYRVTPDDVERVKACFIR